MLVRALTAEEATGGRQGSSRAGRKLARPAPARAAPVTAEGPLADPARPGGDTTAAGAVSAPVLDQRFDAGTLHLLREAVLAHAAAAGMPEPRAGDVMLAVHELASNAVRHGAGSGQLRMWAGAGQLRCQVSDAGAAALNGRAGTTDGQDAAAAARGRRREWPYRPGHGLWLVRQAASQLSMSTGPAGSRVTAVFTMPAAPTAS